MQTEKEKRWQFIVNPFMIKSGVVIFCPSGELYRNIQF